MRDALAPLEGQRITVHGVYSRHGYAQISGGGIEKALLLVGVATPSGDLLADHLWLSQSRALVALNLKPRMLLALRGTVVAYERTNGSRDYNLANIRAARLLAPPPLTTGMEPDVLTALRNRAAVCENAAGKVGELLAHVQHVAYPTGLPAGGNWYASLLEARGRVWEIRAALAEVQSLVVRLGTRPAEVEA